MSIEFDPSSLAQSDPDEASGLPRYEIPGPAAHELMATLEANVVGQDRAKRILSHAVAMHSWRISSGHPLAESPNALFLGPTGSGKTLSAITVADACGVPFVAVEAPSLVPSGIVGFKLEHIAELLWTAAEKMLQQGNYSADPQDTLSLAESGIVFLDEFDKLRDDDVRTGESLRARVQRSLLRFVEGMSIHIGEQQNYSFGRGGRPRTLDSSRILFIAAGAFASIEEERTKRVESNVYKQMFGDSDKVVPEDIKNYGFLPELIGRFEVVGEFSELSVDELSRILSSSPRSPLPSLKGYARSCGVELEFTEGAIRAVAAHSSVLGLGARGLQQLLFPLVTDRLDRAASEGAVLVTVTERDFERRSDLW